jgi:hypothetical protein
VVLYLEVSLLTEGQLQLYQNSTSIHRRKIPNNTVEGHDYIDKVWGSDVVQYPCTKYSHEGQEWENWTEQEKRDHKASGKKLKTPSQQ